MCSLKESNQKSIIWTEIQFFFLSFWSGLCVCQNKWKNTSNSFMRRRRRNISFFRDENETRKQNRKKSRKKENQLMHTVSKWFLALGIHQHDRSYWYFDFHELPPMREYFRCPEY